MKSSLFNQCSVFQTRGCCWTSDIHTWMIKERKKKVTHGGPSYNFYTNANSVLKICHLFYKGPALTESRVHFLGSQPGDKAMRGGND